MIWFGNVSSLYPSFPGQKVPGDEWRRMRMALERVASHSPHLTGSALLDALAGTGWVDTPTAQRLLPQFRDFDADSHFATHLRRLSFRGPTAADEFRAGVARIVEDTVGNAELGTLGPEPAIRFRHADREGIVLAYPEVGFTVAGRVRDAALAAVEEMPDALVVVARNFGESAAGQLAGLLSRTEVPGTLVTVNLLLGVRAMSLHYRPEVDRVIDLLGMGRPLRSTDVAVLGNR